MAFKKRIGQAGSKATTILKQSRGDNGRLFAASRTRDCLQTYNWLDSGTTLYLVYIYVMCGIFFSKLSKRSKSNDTI